MNARAAVFRGVGQPLEWREWPIPQPRGTEVLVEVIACTICGSDLHSVHGRRSVPVPTVLGHEILGRVVAFGPDAPRADAADHPLALGDRVTWAIVASCGTCFYCGRDLPQKCEHAFKYGHEKIRPGRELSGGLADHCLLVPGTAIFRVPDALADTVACPASCATATVGCVLEAAGPISGRVVLIMGAGMLGVTASAWSRTLGAAAVIVCDPNDDRRAAAEAFGATAVAAPELLADVVAKTTGGRGVDSALELSGAPESIERAMPLVRTGGTLVLAGSVFPTPAVAVMPERIVRGCLTVRGVHNYAPRHLHAALQFLAKSPQVPFGALVAPWRPLDEIERLLASAPTAGVLRLGVRPR